MRRAFPVDDYGQPLKHEGKQLVLDKRPDILVPESQKPWKRQQVLGKKPFPIKNYEPKRKKASFEVQSEAPFKASFDGRDLD